MTHRPHPKTTRSQPPSRRPACTSSCADTWPSSSCTPPPKRCPLCSTTQPPRASLTAALERLLAIEVDASPARRLAGRLRFASLPTPATLADFDYDAAAASTAR